MVVFKSVMINKLHADSSKEVWMRSQAARTSRHSNKIGINLLMSRVGENLAYVVIQLQFDINASIDWGLANASPVSDTLEQKAPGTQRVSSSTNFLQDHAFKGRGRRNEARWLNRMMESFSRRSSYCQKLAPRGWPTEFLSDSIDEQFVRSRAFYSG